MTGIQHITLTRTTPADLEQLFLFQLDETACNLAAFMPANHRDKNVWINKYLVHLQDPTINMQTIWLQGTLAGSISKFVMEGDAEITYWIDKQFWGQGIASQALMQFLSKETTRPIYGRVAFDNIGSQRVLEKCGFVRVGSDKGFASARQAEIEEYIYKLD